MKHGKGQNQMQARSRQDSEVQNTGMVQET